MDRFWGKVIKGQNRGKNLGFPTANLNIRKKLPSGIYISEAKSQGILYPSITFIGQNVTFGEVDYHAEVYLLNSQKDLYNQFLSVKILKKIRNNKKFNSAQELIEAMKEDKRVALEYFKKNV